MSLSGVLSNASAALTTAQYQLAVTTANIANASVAGYAARTYDPAIQTTGLALSSGELSRITDVYLQRSVIQSNGEAGRSTVINDFLTRYDSLLGDTAATGNIASLVSGLSTALQTLASGGATSEASTAVEAAGVLADSLRTLSSGIQTLRAQADAQIAATVDRINSLGAVIDGLNDALVAGEGDLTALSDARDAALQELSGLVGVTTFTDPSGRLSVYAGGQALVGAGASPLGFTPAASVSSSSTYPDGLSGVTLAGRDITSTLTGGELGGLLALRDDILPAEQAGLDALAAGVISSLNAAAAQGAATPPSNLASARQVEATTPLSVSGSLLVLQTGATGTVTARTALDLTGVGTVGELMDRLNTVPGLTASLTDGVLTLSSAAGGVALDSSTALTADGSALASWLGFNDVFTGTDASSIRLSPVLSTNASRLALGGLNTSATVGASAVGAGSRDGAAAMTHAMTQPQAFPTAGGIGARTSSPLAYAQATLAAAAGVIASADAQASSDAALRDGYVNALANAVGVNLDEQTALSALYQQQYQSTAQLMSAVQDMFDALLTAMN